MPYRYDSRSVTNISKLEMPNQIKTLRKINSVDIYLSPSYRLLSDGDLEAIDFETHTWSRGDKFYTLAHTYYGDARYWWVIAMFNNTPTEHHLKLGQTILIPEEPELAASLMGVR
jgi:hypothetical protein